MPQKLKLQIDFTKSPKRDNIYTCGLDRKYRVFTQKVNSDQTHGVPYASHYTTASTTSTRKVALPWLFLINCVLSIFKLQIPIVRIMFIITILLQTKSKSYCQ